MATTTPMSGRKAEAARNNEKILEAARAVFTNNPEAPISAVADHAGVGISALYRRYASKEDLLRTLCSDGLQRYIDEAEAALTDDRDPWTVFAGFLERLVDADTHTLTQRLAGTFTPTPELYQAAQKANRLNEEIFARAKAAKAIRPDLEVSDLGLIMEQLASVRIGDKKRTRQLRHRYLTLILDALHPPSATPLPGPAPKVAELAERWDRK